MFFRTRHDKYDSIPEPGCVSYVSDSTSKYVSARGGGLKTAGLIRERTVGSCPRRVRTWVIPCLVRRASRG
jgi:hypothetical protein